ncbi:hypothetical protein QWY31_03110 [Cytophagales bacterium LB-30]|uniref:DUF2157 domain-containing protein n=1 Tax=Shiella aurantiaca TaxID=3058365 RepID=A0ABT8F1Z8_9BACT|nr:hypothetical protein [Shiella aurantiaca]MDN4164472.1 hypothetical protein [Shiella aurantiaca]
MHHLFYLLQQKELISPERAETLRQAYSARPHSLQMALRLIWYVGVSVLVSGLGMLLWAYIDQIGELTISLSLLLLATSAWVYVAKKTPAFAKEEVKSPSTLFDYVLLLAVLLSLSLEAYVQFQYGIFGQAYGLAVGIPTLALFGIAYRFDSKTTLTMAVSSLASWLGLQVSPLKLVGENDWTSETLIYSGWILAILLFLFSWAGKRGGLKAHFTFTYLNIALHVASLSLLGALFSFSYPLLYAIPLAAVLFAGYRYAEKERSFYLIVVVSLYAYVGTTYIMYWLVEYFDFWSDLMVYGILLYLIGTGMGAVKLLKRFKQHIDPS